MDWTSILPACHPAFYPHLSSNQHSHPLINAPFFSKNAVIRWQRLQEDSEARKSRLLTIQEEFRQIEDLYLTFAKRASAFNSWFENAEEDLTDPVRCNR